jgi:hypothetical protein
VCFLEVYVLVKEDEEILTTTTSAGDTSFIVCKTNEENKDQKVCVDLNVSTSSEKRMLDNNTYDLMEQLLIECRSLWHIRNNYKADAAADNETRQLWESIEKEKESIVQRLSEKLRERF